MSTPHTIRHLHLPSTTPFARATAIQNVLVRQHLDHKAITSSLVHIHPLPPTPPPSLFSFSPTPVYTTGRRELGTLSESTIELLKRPLEEIERESRSKHANAEKPEVRETLRGGQITFHGPGQLVIYPILDLKAVKSEKWPKGLSVRCYVNVLEEATINTLKTFGIVGFRTENPGVWVDQETKIAALGLHLRRNITNYGVGLNVRTNLRYFDKIVACGLEGKKTTSVYRELSKRRRHDELVAARLGRQPARTKAQLQDVSNQMEIAHVAKVWGREFVRLVWGEEGVYKQRVTKNEKAIAEFLDNGEGRWVERREEVKDDWEAQREEDEHREVESVQWTSEMRQWKWDAESEKEHLERLEQDRAHKYPELKKEAHRSAVPVKLKGQTSLVRKVLTKSQEEWSSRHLK